MWIADFANSNGSIVHLRRWIRACNKPTVKAELDPNPARAGRSAS